MNSFKPIPFKPEGPTPLSRETPPAEPFPMVALGPLRCAAEAAQDSTQAPAALAAQSALAVASLAAQAHWNVETLAGPKPLSIFCLSIAESGERKSACDKLLTRAIDEYSRELTDERRVEVEKFKNASALWQSKQKEILKKSGIDTAEAKLAALGPEPEPPLLPMVTATDPTVEGIIKQLGHARPSLGIFSDEGGAFLGGSGMSQDNRLKTVAALSGFWDGAPINRTRALDGAVTHYGKRLAMHLMVQHVAADTLLTDPIATGQGFLARLLITAPPSTMGTRLFRDPEQESIAALEEWNARIGVMLRTQPRLRDGTRNELDPPEMPLDPDARQLLIRFHDKVEVELAAGKELETCRAFASKAAEQAARIAGVMTCYADETVVSGSTMAHAITIVGYYIREATRLADAAMLSKKTVKLERLKTWLVESWDEDFISPTDATQCGPFRETSENKWLISKLVEFEWLVLIEGGATIRGKRRREAYRIVRV